MQKELSEAHLKEACHVESICTRCDFYDGSDDELECAGFRILRELLNKGVISIKDIDDAKIKQPKQK